MHCLLQLLQQGYQVRTAIRDLNKKEKTLEMLRNGGINNFEQLESVEADLTSDKNGDEAVLHCDYILHMASPIFLPGWKPRRSEETILVSADSFLKYTSL